MLILQLMFGNIVRLRPVGWQDLVSKMKLLERLYISAQEKGIINEAKISSDESSARKLSLEYVNDMLTRIGIKIRPQDLFGPEPYFQGSLLDAARAVRLGSQAAILENRKWHLISWEGAANADQVMPVSTILHRAKEALEVGTIIQRFAKATEKITYLNLALENKDASTFNPVEFLEKSHFVVDMMDAAFKEASRSLQYYRSARPETLMVVVKGEVESLSQESEEGVRLALRLRKLSLDLN